MMVKRSALGLGALLAVVGCGSRPRLEDPPPSFGRGPDTIERFCPEPADEIWNIVTGTLERNGFGIEFDEAQTLAQRR